jgi:hypothetical protein
MRSGVLALALVAAGSGAAAGDRYAFLSTPQINFSLLYRLDRLTGDVIACQFGHNPGRTDVGPGGYGVTACFRGGDGAVNQPPGDYDLTASRNEQEGGVFRADHRSGAISICYLYFQREKQGEGEKITDQYVVCTMMPK